MFRKRFFYISGCDGTGKTTQARLLLAGLSELGVQPRHLWLRFPFFFCLPLLAYARWQNYTWYEETNGVRHGYWDFRHSWLLRNVLPWVLFLDAALASIGKIYLPLMLGKTIVCERFVLDMLVDLSVALAAPDLYRHLPGQLFLCLIPKRSGIVILDLDSKTIRLRRKDLVSDHRLEVRLQAYRLLAEALSLPLVSSMKSPAKVNDKLLQEFCITNEAQKND